MVSSPPLGHTDNPFIQAAIEHISGGLPKTKPERDAHFVELSTILCSISSNAEPFLADHIDRAVEIISKIDSEIEGGLNYLIPLTIRMARVIAELQLYVREDEVGYEQHTIHSDQYALPTEREFTVGNQVITTYTTPSQAPLSKLQASEVALEDVHAIAAQVLTNLGIDQKVASAIIGLSKNFGIASSVEGSRQEWEMFRPQHIRLMKPVIDALIELVGRGGGWGRQRCLFG